MDDEPPASILTPRQREFVRGERETSDGAARAMRGRIRERLAAAIEIDFQLLMENREALDLINPIAPDQKGPNRAWHKGLRAMVALVHGAASTYLRHPERVIEAGVSRGERDFFGRSSNATLDIELTPEPRGIATAFDRGDTETLTEAERKFVISVLNQKSDFDGDSFHELARDAFDPEE